MILFWGSHTYHRQPVEGASEVAAELDSPTFEASAAGTIWACAPIASYPALLLAVPGEGVPPEHLVRLLLHCGRWENVKVSKIRTWLVGHSGVLMPWTMPTRILQLFTRQYVRTLPMRGGFTGAATP
jgi:hypothetical protein